MSLDFSWLADPTYQSWLLQGMGTTIALCICAFILMWVIGVVGAGVLYFQVPFLETLTTIAVELLRKKGFDALRLPEGVAEWGLAPVR